MSAEPALLPAWNDAVHDAQATFRCILRALAEPGLIQVIPVELEAPAPLDAATAVACLTLADLDTPLWLDAGARDAAVQAWLRFHCGCALPEDTGAAHFAVITEAAKGIDLQRFAQGDIAYPDRSATLLVQVPTLTEGPVRTLSGPGIPGTRALRVARLAADFNRNWALNGAGFPLGVDIIFCCGNQIVGLPRTTVIAA